MSNFQDFIPDGGDNTAYKNGFNDFQPTPAPVAEVAPEAVVESAPVKEPSFKELKAEYEALANVKLKVGTKKVDLIQMIADLKAAPATPVSDEVVAAVPVEPVAETVTEPVVEEAPVAEVAPEA